MIEVRDVLYKGKCQACTADGVTLNEINGVNVCSNCFALRLQSHIDNYRITLSTETEKKLRAILMGCMLSKRRRDELGDDWVNAEITLLKYLLGDPAVDPFNYEGDTSFL